MPLLLHFLLFFTSPFSHAQQCSCPVVQCDPCQRRMVIDSQKVQCTPDKNIVCENVVCENVDNYFQCLAGAQSMHLPIEDAFARMSTPQFKESAPVAKPVELPGLEFQHFSTVETKISPEEKPGPLPRLRGPASSRKTAVAVPALEKQQYIESAKQIQEKTMPLLIQGLTSATIDGKKMRVAKAHTLTGAESVLAAPHKQTVTFTYGKVSGHMVIAPGSEIRIVKEDEHLVFHPVKGRIVIKKITAPDMLIVDAGEWRVGKTDGEVRWSHKNKDTVVENAKGKALLRRDQLIAKSEAIPEGMELVISDDYGIVHADQESLSKSKAPAYELNEKTSAPKQRRVLASQSIANEGCAQPQGEVQQCAWKCFGAKGKNCENSETTQCVRFTCSLGGEWKLPTRVPGKECSARTVEVHPCN